jgi:ketosteroid isomerase-like protein
VSTPEAVEQVKRLYKLSRRGNPLELLDLLAPDASWEGAEGTRWKACETGEEVAKTMLWRGAANRFRPSDLVPVGSQVVLTLNGRRMTNLGASLWRSRIYQVVTVRGGKITRIQDFRRREEALAAVGLEPNSR